MESQTAFFDRVANLNDPGLVKLVAELAPALVTDPRQLLGELKFCAWLYRQWVVSDDANGPSSEVVDDLREIETKAAVVVDALASIDKAINRLGPEAKSFLQVGAGEHYGVEEFSTKPELGTVLRMVGIQASSATAARIIERATGYRKNKSFTTALKVNSQRMLALFCKDFAEDRGCRDEMPVVWLAQIIHAIQADERIKVTHKGGRVNVSSQWGRKAVQSVFQNSRP